MSAIMLLTLFVAASFCDDRTQKFEADDFKCSLPDVTSVDNDLDIRRFRSDFAKISEVKFPGLIGPLNERLICKIKCVDGNWVGPLCSATQDGRFQPILRECLYHNQNPLLAVTFNNESVTADTYFPHGSALTVRCKHFGLYKLAGDNTLRCDNGDWAPKLPACVPTTLITNYTGGVPPTVQFVAAAGSAAVDARGELLVFPGSTLWLDCLWPRVPGGAAPDWSWSHAGRHNADWAPREAEAEGDPPHLQHYRLVLARVAARQSGRYTCTSPGGTTHTVSVRVVSVACAPVAAAPHVRQFAQGSRLGDAVHFSCAPGYHLNGSAVVRCTGDGRWSPAPPACVRTRCPALRAPGPHATLVELDAAPGGRAVFACAWGYRLIGAPGLECEPGGRWSGAVPRCEPIYCPEPLVPARARLAAAGAGAGAGARRFPVGELLVYACDAGFSLAGEASIVCTESGFWSHPPPFCVRAAAARRADTITVDNATLVYLDE